MANIPSQHALKLAVWLATQHPDVFKQIARRVTVANRSPLGRFGCCGPQGGARMGRFGWFGDAGLSDITLQDLSTPDIPPPSVDASSFDTGPALSDISALSFDAPSVNIGADSSGGFWSNLGQSMSNFGSDITSGIGKVAGALTNPQTLQSVAGLASSIFQAKGAASQAQLANLQFARTAAGSAPAPVAYTRNPSTGQVVPVYYPPNAPPQAVSPGLVASLAPSGWSLTTVALVGGATVVALMLLS